MDGTEQNRTGRLGRQEGRKYLDSETASHEGERTCGQMGTQLSKVSTLFFLFETVASSNLRLASGGIFKEYLRNSKNLRLLLRANVQA